MALLSGTIVNALAGLLAWALGGPLWGGVVFMAVALVRMGLEVHALRLQNAELHHLLAHVDHAEAGDYMDDAPESELRLRPGFVADRASQSGA